MRQITRRSLVSLVALFLLPLSVTSQVAAATQGRDARRSPLFGAIGFPEPPQQKAAWNLPRTTLPDALVTATLALFDQGLADPRGCESREAQTATGSVWGGSSVAKLHVRVLPATGASEQRFGVAWNGLIYPLVSVGVVADARAEVFTGRRTSATGRLLPASRTCAQTKATSGAFRAA